MSKFWKVFGHTLQGIGVAAAAAVITDPTSLNGVIPPKAIPYVAAGSVIFNALFPSLAGAIKGAAGAVKAQSGGTGQ